MSTAPPTPDSATHAHPPHLAHHFDSPGQQFSASVLGMWLFVATEVLLFGGLFCAYAVYRANHPAIFTDGHRHLSVQWGAINTVILLLSSFTIAAAVWAAQRSRQVMLRAMLAVTILCALAFLCIKYVEYKHKWEHGLLWSKYYAPQPSHDDAEPGAASDPHAERTITATGGRPAAETATLPAADPSWFFQPVGPGPTGLFPPGAAVQDEHPRSEAQNVHSFFSIYFTMTGLHALHVIAGIVAISWLLVLAFRGRFTAEHFTPVPMVGLYWHVVDLVWIYLFPLFYLIH